MACLCFDHRHITINVVPTILFTHSLAWVVRCAVYPTLTSKVFRTRQDPSNSWLLVYFFVFQTSASSSSCFELLQWFVSICSTFNMLLPVEIEDLESVTTSCRSAHTVECSRNWCFTYVLYPITFFSMTYTNVGAFAWLPGALSFDAVRMICSITSCMQRPSLRWWAVLLLERRSAIPPMEKAWQRYLWGTERQRQPRCRLYWLASLWSLKRGEIC